MFLKPVGYDEATNWCWIVESSLFACTTETPCRKRPTTFTIWIARLLISRCSGRERGTRTSGSPVLDGKTNDAGMMPAISRGVPSTKTLVPTTERSPPKRLCQNGYERMTVAVAPGMFSSGRNARPAIGCTPNIGRKDAVTPAKWIRSGRGPPVKSNSPSS